MISLFKKKESFTSENNFLKVDMHSHLLPGIDDGCTTIEESIKCIERFHKRGYKKLITTPHIISGYFENTPEIIAEKLALVQEAIDKTGIDIVIEAAAEYYVDEFFVGQLEQGKKFLTFGDNYILIELGFYNEPALFASTVFNLQSEGYKPVLAHPERYLYVFNQLDKVKEWVEKGVLLQINLLSLIGYYSPSSQLFCEKLIDEGMVSFAGSDGHNPKHLEILAQTYKSKYFEKLAGNNLLNNTLL